MGRAPAKRGLAFPLLLGIVLALGCLLDRGGLAKPRDEAEVLPKELRSEHSLLVAHKSQYRMRLYEYGKLMKTYVIALGQNPVGHKREEGDNRTPEGCYRIIRKAVGPFPGAVVCPWHSGSAFTLAGC